MSGHEVVLYLGEFDGDLWALSRMHHVWLGQSAHNEALAKEVWSRDTAAATPCSGVTTFEASRDAVADLYRWLSVIDEHHDEHAGSEPWSRIHVRGLRLEDVDESRIAGELDAERVRILPESGGFAIVR